MGGISMAIKIRYQYRVYEGCEEATEKSKSWERTKSLGWSIWLCLGFGTFAGANAISQLILHTYEADMFWPMIIPFVVFLLMAYSYVFRSKYVYPTCEELFLASRKNITNAKEIEEKISSISSQKWKDVKKALIKFSIIYFTILIALVVFYSLG
jgi:hypothetical protein